MRTRYVSFAAVVAAATAVAVLGYGRSGREDDSGPPNPEVVRGCGTAQGGRLDPDWQRDAVTVGPLSFYAFEPFPTSGRFFLPVRPGHYRPFKVLALVKTGAVVTVVVPETDRQHVSLVYDQKVRPQVPRTGMRVRDGHYSVVFGACRGVHQENTQFGGGFVVAGPRCSRLEIFVVGEHGSRDLRLPLGRSC